MKTLTNKYSKRVLSIALAIAMLVGTVFTANVGVNLTANAETETTEPVVWYWDGTSENINTSKHTGTSTDPYIIENAKQLNYLAMRTGDAASEGKYYKIADGVDAIVLQPESLAADIMALSSSADVKAYFEEHTSELKDWMGNCNWFVFDGNFDGNGVPIYGLYATNNITKTDGGCSLFPRVDGGARGTEASPNTDNVGVDYKNIIVRNSYFSATGKPVGAIIGIAYGQNHGASVNGTINVSSVEVSNCYLYTDNTNDTSNGVLTGNCTEEVIKIEKALVYGNDATYNSGATAMPLIASYDGSRTSPSNASEYIYNSVKNSLILGVTPYNPENFNWRATAESDDCFFHVYTDKETRNLILHNSYDKTKEYPVNYSAAQMSKIDFNNIKGAKAILNMPNFNFATDTTDGDWYAIEGGYPTPIKPTGWKDVDRIITWNGSSADITEGDGSKENPYIIKTAEQLYKMVIDGGKVDGVAKYYKVADNVTELYLNYVNTKDEIVSLVNSGSYNAWNNGGTSTTSPNTFDGYFDGNGVTIYGMVSVNAATPGFVSSIGASAKISNVNFAAAYVYSNSYAAVVSTKTTEYNTSGIAADAKSYVNNVTVCQSYIQGAHAAGLVATTDTPKLTIFNNCLFNGLTSTLANFVPGDTALAGNSDFAGIASFPVWGNNFQFNNCVSIGAYIVPMVTSTANATTDKQNYNRYSSTKTTSIDFSNCYSPVNAAMYGDKGPDETTANNHAQNFDLLTNNVTPFTAPADGKTYDETVLASLDYLNTWQLVEFDDGTTLPMPIKSSEVESLNDTIATAQNGRGANNGRPYDDGTYGMYHEFAGSGTADDPYIIDSAEKLAYAIGCGGVNLKDTLHYKLVCDIDLTGKTWITRKGVKSQYTYVSFKGVLDGNGHTITGLASTEMNGAGLVPVLDGGTVKNLKIVGSYIGSDSISSTGAVQTTVVAGAVAGTATENGGTVENCSVIDTAVNSGNNTANKVAGDGITTTNCTYITKTTDAKTNEFTYATSYVGVNGDTPVADYNGKEGTVATWYCGGAEGSQPQLVVNATTTETFYNEDGSINRVDTYVDIDGDGISNRYGCNDLTVMRRRLSRKKGYMNVYGDTNQDGKINTSDIVILKRIMTNDYADLEDGFWRNVALGKVGIYYAENDTYDMARSLELFLEQSVPGVDVIKYAGPDVSDETVENRYEKDKLPTKNAVIVECTNNGTADGDTDKGFTVTFDSKKNLVKISGGSFTAVEAAVNEFMSNSNALTNTVYAGSGTLSDTYASKTINGTTYYYAWGDEFDTGDTYSSNDWSIIEYKSKTVDKDGNEVNEGRYLNKVNPNVSDLKELYVVNDGKLTIWRGVNADATTVSEDTYKWGYKTLHLGNNNTPNDFNQKVDSTDVFVDAGAIHTSNSMLFKQGYIEMKATLPSDGHAFPAWWFLTSPAHKNNNYYDATLYSKVYKKNNDWDGTNKMLANDLKTYKYQLPTAHLEYDIMEFMQYDEVTEGNWLTNQFGTSKDVTLTGAYITKLHLTVHKTYDENSLYNETDKKWELYIPDWSTGTSTKWTKTFKSTGGGEFVHKYFKAKDKDNGTFTYDFGSIGNVKNEPHVFGFEWKVNQTDDNYSIDVYVDGIKQMSINQDDGHNSTEYGEDPTHTKGGDDAALWNQYAFMLLDNSFYSASESTKYTREKIGDDWVGDGKPSQFTDLLTQESGDTAQFTIDYVRVYQQDNMRDIITPETEAFNTGNHFGYGVK